MLQQIAPSIFHNEYKPVPPGDDDIVFFFRERTAAAVWPRFCRIFRKGKGSLPHS